MQIAQNLLQKYYIILTVGVCVCDWESIHLLVCQEACAYATYNDGESVQFTLGILLSLTHILSTTLARENVYALFISVPLFLTFSPLSLFHSFFI